MVRLTLNVQSYVELVDDPNIEKPSRLWETASMLHEKGYLFQFLGKAEGEFDAGDEAGEFVFTAEGADTEK